MTAYLEDHLGRRIPTKELAKWLDLDVDQSDDIIKPSVGYGPFPVARFCSLSGTWWTP